MAQVPYIVWKEEFSVGFRKLDDQHKRIFAFIDDLYEEIRKQKKDHSSFVHRILQDLLEYTRTHFLDEESIMQECNYPEYQAHRKRHEQMAGETRRLVQQYKEYPGDISFDLFQFLKNWWTDHILSMDMKYAPFFKKK